MNGERQRGPLLPSNRASPTPAMRVAGAQRYPMPPQRGHSDRSLQIKKTRFANCSRSPGEPPLGVRLSDYDFNRGSEAGPRTTDDQMQFGRRTRSASEPWASRRSLSPFGRAAERLDPGVLANWCTGSPTHGCGRDSPIQLKWRPPPIVVSASSLKGVDKDAAIVRLPDPPPPKEVVPPPARPEAAPAARNAQAPVKADSFDARKGFAHSSGAPGTRELLL